MMMSELCLVCAVLQSDSAVLHTMPAAGGNLKLSR